MTSLTACPLVLLCPGEWQLEGVPLCAQGHGSIAAGLGHAMLDRGTPVWMAQPKLDVTAIAAQPCWGPTCPQHVLAASPDHSVSLGSSCFPMAPRTGSHCSLTPRCAASFPTAAVAQKGPWHKPSRFPWIASAAFPPGPCKSKGLSMLCSQESASPSHRKVGTRRKSPMSPCCTPVCLGSGSIHVASSALSLHSHPLAPRGRNGGVG